MPYYCAGMDFALKKGGKDDKCHIKRKKKKEKAEFVDVA